MNNVPCIWLREQVTFQWDDDNGDDVYFVLDQEEFEDTKVVITLVGFL